MTKGRVATALAIATAAITFMFLAGSAAAQYPPPKGSLLCSSSELSGGNTVFEFSATLTRTDGTPVVGEVVAFSLSGRNATLTSSSDITDGNGTANVTILTNGTDFSFMVTAANDGLQCRAVAQLSPPPPPEVRIIETRSVISIITPPKTGNGGLADTGHDSDNTAELAGGVAVVLGVLGIGWLAARRRIA